MLEIAYHILILIDSISLKDLFFGFSCLYCDRTDQNWQEAEWEREGGWDRERSSELGFKHRDTHSATALYGQRTAQKAIDADT